ncbi:hypothetical protein AVEN_154414-1 [Araneus ventricosus]|uniref:Uncharacterized protein n=1 Tax=Araneus ventricosus TaxID=182803 RepID=A0A4Y2KE86_ARAVE|nr:hypothetical protein AVEN_154414-1 [Araneus ventricosus]
MKETYETQKHMLSSIEYSKHSWNICADLKVIAVLVGLQASYTKFFCFLCQWEYRDRKKVLHKKVWPKRQFLIPGAKNEEKEPIVASEKKFLPPLHIKLGLMKNFVKAMDCGGNGFQYLRLKFPKVSETKIKEGIFVGPQFRQLMKDPVFESKLTKKEAAARISFKELEKNFFGNLRQIVNNFLKGLQHHGMQHVIENPFLAFLLRILPCKPWISKRRAW